jgi:hypothetical protein
LTDLFINSGDQLSVDIHDGAAGLTVIVHDLTTVESGSMTASAAAGFAQVDYDPNATTCSQRAVLVLADVLDLERAHARAVGGAQLNVAFSDEIGHFEYCSAITEEGGDCTANGEATLDDDDTGWLLGGLLDLRPDHGLHRE